MRVRKVLYLVTEDWYFCSHRLPIARAARDRGYEVIVATRVAEHGEKIRSEGFRVEPLPWSRRSRHPLAEWRTFVRLLRLYRSEKPDVVHHVALKPVLYGALAVALTRPSARPRGVVNALAGLGYVFTSRQFKALVMRLVFRVWFRLFINRANASVIVQNPDDRDALASARAVDPERLVLIRGSGVDLGRFSPEPGGEAPAPTTVTMVSRMLWSKGAGELVKAARVLARDGMRVRVQLVGRPDPENPESIPVAKLEEWQSEGVIEWLGHRDDIPSVWRDSHVAVLPTTYGEGVPKSLLEAAACGRPLIATDVPGCREVVIHGQNGLLVPTGDTAALATAITSLAEDPALRAEMGRRGREMVAQSFGEEVVVEKTMALYESLLREDAPR